MSVPVVSIIVPNYNHSKFLEQRLASIFNQTYQDFEVIILDDCSTDNSREIIERYRSHSKVTTIVYNEVNSGSPFKQWDKGIQMSKGDYIWIAESDDTCEHQFLETLMSKIRKMRNCVLAYCCTNDIDKEGIIIPKVRNVERNKLYSGTSFVVNRLLFGNCVYNASCAIFKKSSALSISKEWVNSRGSGDYWFWVLLAEKGNVYSIHETLAYRRLHESNVTIGASTSGSNLKDVRLIINHIYNTYHIAVWRKILVENLKRRCVLSESFDNEEIRDELRSLWTYGSKLGLLPELITKAYYTIIKWNL